jgi:hypothetical protein
VVIASVDTYLKFAEAVNRLDLYPRQPQGLPEVLEGAGRQAVSTKTRGALQGVKDVASDIIGTVRRGKPERSEQEEGSHD